MNSETLEEKYKYMCELAEDMSREVYEQKKIIAGAQKKEEELMEIITEISAIIYYQSSLKEQDDWLSDMMKRGLFEVEEDKSETTRVDMVDISEVVRVDEKYIYESPDGGDTIYRRKFGEDKREKIKSPDWRH